ncbi:MAG: DUF423 domain-containing protein [Paludibacter sp.]|nr:DUF423 domain-containing protein [Paludibacter sp.]
MKSILTIAAISGLLAVVLGAFGAHALKKMISPEMLEVYKTGVQYQFYHTFTLLAVGVLMHFNISKALKWSGYLFVLGILLFSGSLYVMTITGIKALGIITPFGGTVWIAAWFLLMIHCRKLTNSK